MTTFVSPSTNEVLYISSSTKKREFIIAFKYMLKRRIFDFQQIS